ncbi:uncharacterized protein LOC129940852 [Eupeodes corollae]|uniref:uncharacterized protein LOC129940852 n=1 Tax=Eupeodes corollae TaxID=290404 RepID=UPI002492CDA8|nr:uncharacterized protein LOC129940852 [Eupeodes corollae]
MDTKRIICAIVVILAMLGLTQAGAKYEGPNSYNDNTQWRRQYFNEKKNDSVAESTANKDRLERLGYTTGYGHLNGYSGTGISAYNPIKLDLGGVVLGTLVGIGAILIIPKILSAFHGGYGSYARSTGEAEGDLSGLANMMNKIDDILGQNNIDSTSCMQRAVCSYVRSTENNMKAGSDDQIDHIIHTLSENSLVDYLLDGTAIKEALENGRKINGKECELIYSSCPVDSKTAMNVVTTLLPKTPKN